MQEESTGYLYFMTFEIEGERCTCIKTPDSEEDRRIGLVVSRKLESQLDIFDRNVDKILEASNGNLVTALLLTVQLGENIKKLKPKIFKLADVPNMLIRFKKVIHKATNDNIVNPPDLVVQDDMDNKLTWVKVNEEELKNMGEELDFLPLLADHLEKKLNRSKFREEEGEKIIQAVLQKSEEEDDSEKS